MGNLTKRINKETVRTSVITNEGKIHIDTMKLKVKKRQPETNLTIQQEEMNQKILIKEGRLKRYQKRVE